MIKKKYVPELAELMAECEANYARLCKLMPDMQASAKRVFNVDLRQFQDVQVCLEVVEEFKYTATLKLTHHEGKGHWLKMPNLLVRIYHDARMAEVVETTSSRQLRGNYDYPNEKMYQPDEKMQRNLYLAEWLRKCLAHGSAVDELKFATA